GREDAGRDHERRQGVRPGRGLPGRRDDGGGGSRAAADWAVGGDLRHVGLADRVGEDDFRSAGRWVAAGGDAGYGGGAERRDGGKRAGSRPLTLRNSYIRKRQLLLR